MKYFLTEEELQEIETRHKAGESYTSLAKEQNMPDVTLIGKLNRHRHKQLQVPQTIFLKLRKPYKTWKITNGKKRRT